MPPKKLSLVTTQQHFNRRLDHVLAEWLPIALNQPISKGKVRKLVVAGAVYLNGKRVRIASKELLVNVRIEVFVDLQKLNSEAKASDIPFTMTEDRILFEDPYLIAVDKPPGLPTQPTLDEARDNLFAAVKKFLKNREGHSPTSYLGLHHRLDRDTSGVILFTKSQEANPGVAELFASHLAVKTYLALSAFEASKNASSTLPDQWHVKNYLARSKTEGKRSKYCSVRSGGDFAHTDFKILEKMKQVLLIEAQPRTGRTHQIRVHLSGHSLPILGDLTYGGRSQVGHLKIPRLMLHAANLTFPHPIHKNRISIQSSIPGDFHRCLEALKRGQTDF